MQSITVMTDNIACYKRINLRLLPEIADAYDKVIALLKACYGVILNGIKFCIGHDVDSLFLPNAERTCADS